MRKLIYLLALWAPMASAQCDVEISSWNAATGADASAGLACGTDTFGPPG